MSSGGDGDVFAAERIENSRTRRGATEYLIKWQGWSRSHNTWEPEENVLDTRLIDDFRLRKKQQKSAASASSKRASSPVSSDVSDDRHDGATQPRKLRKRSSISALKYAEDSETDDDGNVVVAQQTIDASDGDCLSPLRICIQQGETANDTDAMTPSSRARISAYEQQRKHLDDSGLGWAADSDGSPPQLSPVAEAASSSLGHDSVLDASSGPVSYPLAHIDHDPNEPRPTPCNHRLKYNDDLTLTEISDGGTTVRFIEISQ